MGLQNPWRNTGGQAGTGLAADGNNGGVVNGADDDLWRAHLGASLGPTSGSAGYGHRDSGPGASAQPLSAAVPEPATFALQLVFPIAIAYRRTRGVPCALWVNGRSWL